MGIKIKHLRLRDGRYQYVRRVPKDVCDTPGALAAHFGGQRVVRRSLWTANPSRAVAAADAIAKEFDLKVAIVRQKPMSNPQPEAAISHLLIQPRSRPVTGELLAEIREERRRQVEMKFRRLVLERERGGDHADYANSVIEMMEMDAADTMRVLVEGVPSRDPSLDMDVAAKEVINRYELAVEAGSDDEVVLRATIRQAELEGRRSGFDIVYGRSPLVPSEEVKPQTCKMSEAINKYVEDMTNGRTITGIREAARAFIGVVGDLRMHELKPTHFRDFCVSEAAVDVGGKSRGSVKRPRSAATIKKKLTFLRAAIQDTIDSHEFAGPNPASRIAVEVFARRADPTAMPKKRPFSSTELGLIVQYPWFTGCLSHSRKHVPGDFRLSGMWYWGPVIAMLTGCRASEIAGLALNEVYLDEQFPHILVRPNRFRTTKNGHSRQVPVLDQLLELGFGKFIEHQRQRGAARVLDDWELPPGVKEYNARAFSNGSMMRSFNGTLIPAVMADRLLPEARREVTFHSFRGAFKKMLQLRRWGIPPNTINEVIGHAKSQMDESYTQVVELEETYPALRGCHYQGLIIPPAPPLS